MMKVRKTFFLNNKAKLPRNKTISWNIVPCYIGNEDKRKIRAANAVDISKGKQHLLRLLELLPKLRAVVFVGQKAKGAETDIRRNKPDLKLF